MKHTRIAAALAAGLLGCIVFDINVLRQSSPGIVSAEERGISVDLRYQRGYSTWGPTNVYGTAVLWPREGVATLSVHLLPRLQGGDRYVWWVLNSSSGAALRLGTFNTSNAGDSFLDTFLARGLPKGADAVVVSIAAKNDKLAAPSASRSLFGAVPPQALVVQPGTPAPAGQSGPAGSENPHATGANPSADGTSPARSHGAPYRLPSVLPMTGGAQASHGRQE